MSLDEDIRLAARKVKSGEPGALRDLLDIAMRAGPDSDGERYDVVTLLGRLELGLEPGKVPAKFHAEGSRMVLDTVQTAVYAKLGVHMEPGTLTRPALVSARSYDGLKCPYVKLHVASVAGGRSATATAAYQVGVAPPPTKRIDASGPEARARAKSVLASFAKLSGVPEEFPGSSLRYYVCTCGSGGHVRPAFVSKLAQVYVLGVILRMKRPPKGGRP